MTSRELKRITEESLDVGEMSVNAHDATCSPLTRYAVNNFASTATSSTSSNRCVNETASSIFAALSGLAA